MYKQFDTDHHTSLLQCNTIILQVYTHFSIRNYNMHDGIVINVQIMLTDQLILTPSLLHILVIIRCRHG